MTETSVHQKTPWGQERRLQFIDFRLRWEGRLNRRDLVEHFGISAPQASIDISKYIELAPTNLRYDSSSRTYHAADLFKPVYIQSSANRYLADLLATKSGVLELGGSLIGDGVEIDFAPVPSRAIDDDVVVAIVMAIKGRRTVVARYHSMSTSGSERTLSPLALGHDGYRWHLRAFCHTRNRFSDFVLTRLRDVRDSGKSPVSLAQDIEWNTIVPLVITPHPALSAEKQFAIAYDYGMTNGEALLPCRQSFLFYTLKHLGLADQDESIPKYIHLKNQPEVQPYLDAIRNRS